MSKSTERAKQLSDALEKVKASVLLLETHLRKAARTKYLDCPSCKGAEVVTCIPCATQRGHDGRCALFNSLYMMPVQQLLQTWLDEETAEWIRDHTEDIGIEVKTTSSSSSSSNQSSKRKRGEDSDDDVPISSLVQASNKPAIAPVEEKKKKTPKVRQADDTDTDDDEMRSLRREQALIRWNAIPRKELISKAEGYDPKGGKLKEVFVAWALCNSGSSSEFSTCVEYMSYLSDADKFSDKPVKKAEKKKAKKVASSEENEDDTEKPKKVHREKEFSEVENLISDVPGFDKKGTKLKEAFGSFRESKKTKHTLFKDSKQFNVYTLTAKKFLEDAPKREKARLAAQEKRLKQKSTNSPSSAETAPIVVKPTTPIVEPVASKPTEEKTKPVVVAATKSSSSSDAKFDALIKSLMLTPKDRKYDPTRHHLRAAFDAFLARSGDISQFQMSCEYMDYVHAASQFCKSAAKPVQTSIPTSSVSFGDSDVAAINVTTTSSSSSSPPMCDEKTTKALKRMDGIADLQPPVHSRVCLKNKLDKTCNCWSYDPYKPSKWHAQKQAWSMGTHTDFLVSPEHKEFADKFDDHTNLYIRYTADCEAEIVVKPSARKRLRKTETAPVDLSDD